MVTDGVSQKQVNVMPRFDPTNELYSKEPIVIERVGNINERGTRRKNSGYYEIHKCVQCGEHFKVQGCRIRQALQRGTNVGVFCSRECRYQWMKEHATYGSIAEIGVEEYRRRRNADPVYRRYEKGQDRRRREAIFGTGAIPLTGECVCGGQGFVTHRHHLIPRHCGGSDEAWNLIELCQRHHMRASGLQLKWLIELVAEEKGLKYVATYFRSRFDEEASYT